MTLPPLPDRWTIELANGQRLEAVAAFGFTERQARFLLNVLLHSGVFVERQYCSFAGIVHGQKSTDFIKTLVERRFATPITTGKLHRGRMFHARRRSPELTHFCSREMTQTEITICDRDHTRRSERGAFRCLSFQEFR